MSLQKRPIEATGEKEQAKEKKQGALGRFFGSLGKMCSSSKADVAKDAETETIKQIGPGSISSME